MAVINSQSLSATSIQFWDCDVSEMINEDLLITLFSDIVYSPLASAIDSVYKYKLAERTEKLGILSVKHALGIP